VKIIVADDDPQMLVALRIILRAHGYDALTARNGAEALDLVATERPDLLVLDLGMPQLDGLDVIRAVRGWSTLPILVVSGRSDSTDKVEALDAGADDYVSKPFATDEFLARIRALTRRSVGSADAPVIRFADVTVDLGDKAVSIERDGKSEPVRLTPTEWQILELLARNPRKLITQRTMLTELRGPQHLSDTGYLRLYIAQLRKKLEPDPTRPRYILTEPGMGYRFQPDEEPGEPSAS
jgi:two-component system KDP operon response regulator KdpE